MCACGHSWWCSCSLNYRTRKFHHTDVVHVMYANCVIVWSLWRLVAVNCAKQLCSFAGGSQAVIQDLDFNIQWIQTVHRLGRAKTLANNTTWSRAFLHQAGCRGASSKAVQTPFCQYGISLSHNSTYTIDVTHFSIGYFIHQHYFIHQI